MAFNVPSDLSEKRLESIWVELLLPKTKGILDCIIYRLPRDGGFLEKLEGSLQRLEPEKEVYILGDF